MNAEQLSRVGEKLVKRCGSRDPFEIARQLGINVMLCENFGSLKGMYRVIKRNRFIFLNNSLDENMLRIPMLDFLLLSFIDCFSTCSIST